MKLIQTYQGIDKKAICFGYKSVYVAVTNYIVTKITLSIDDYPKWIEDSKLFKVGQIK